MSEEGNATYSDDFHRRLKAMDTAGKRLGELIYMSSVERQGGLHREMYTTALEMLASENLLVTARSHLGPALLALIVLSQEGCRDGPAVPARPPPSTPGQVVGVCNDLPEVKLARRWLTPEEVRECSERIDEVVETVHPSYLLNALLPLRAPHQTFVKGGKVLYPQIISELLSRCVARPGGVRSISDALLMGVDASQLEAYDRVALVVTTPPRTSPTVESHVVSLAPQLVNAWLDREAFKSHHGVLVMLCVHRLLKKHRVLALRHVVYPVLAPLLLACPQTPHHRYTSKRSASGVEVANAVEALHRAMVTHQALFHLLAPLCLPALLLLHSLLFRSVLFLRSAVSELLVRYLKAHPAEGRTLLQAHIDGGTLQLQGEAEEIEGLPSLRTQPTVSSGVSYRPDSDGGVALVAGEEQSPSDHLGALIDLLESLSKAHSPLPGDLLSDLVSDDTAPPRLVIRLLDSLGASVLKNSSHALRVISALLRSSQDPATDDPDQSLALAVSLIELQLTGGLAVGKDVSPDLVRDVQELLADVRTDDELLQQGVAAARLGILDLLRKTSEGSGGEAPPPNADEAELYKVFHDLADKLLPTRGHALITLRKMVLRRSECVAEHFDEVYRVFAGYLADDDSFLFLPAINGLAALCDTFPAKSIPLLLSDYAAPATPSEARPTPRRDDPGHYKPSKSKQGTDVKRELKQKEEDTLVKLADALLYAAWRCGEALPVHGEAFFDAFFSRAHFRQHPLVRGSAIHGIGFLLGEMKWSIRRVEAIQLARDVLSMDPEPLCRRAAGSLLHQAVEGADLEPLVEELPAIFDTALRHLYDPDEVLAEYSKLVIKHLNDYRHDLYSLPRQDLFAPQTPSF